MLSDPAFASPGQFFKGNLHTHSTRSDGRLTPEAICAHYREAGYDFLALTDHFLRGYDFPIVDTSEWRRDGFTTIFGAEVHAPETALGEWWHVLAVGLPLDFSPTAPDETGPELARRAIESGAFVALAHPTWYGLTPEDAAAIPEAHAIEIYNHNCEVITARGDSTHYIDHLLANGRRTTVVAVDDAHCACDDFFGGFVMVKAQENSPESLLAALKAGAFYSSQGPLIHDILFDGDFAEISCSPASAIIALGRGPRSDEVVERGSTRARLDLGRLKDGGYVRFVVMDERGRRAWSNPLWF